MYAGLMAACLSGYKLFLHHELKHMHVLHNVVCYHTNISFLAPVEATDCFADLLHQMALSFWSCIYADLRSV